MSNKRHFRVSVALFQKMTHRFAVLHCERGSEWRDMDHHFQRAFEASGDEWECFHIYREGTVFPELTGYKGYIITGSNNSAYDNDPWIRELESFVQRFYARYGNIEDPSCPKLYGSCFGCQVIGKALGGHVERIPDDSHKMLFSWNGKMIYKVEHVKPTEEFRAFVNSITPAAHNLQLPEELHLIESHGDHVRDLPPAASLFASSASYVLLSPISLHFFTFIECLPLFCALPLCFPCLSISLPSFSFSFFFL